MQPTHPTPNNASMASPIAHEGFSPFTGEEFLPFRPPIPIRERLTEEAPEPARRGAGSADCGLCAAPDEHYVWVSERWRVRATTRPTGLPVVLGLELRPHLDLGDLPNLLAAELGVMTVRLERAIRSLPGIAQVHVDRWGDGESHLQVWFLARPSGQLRLRGPYLPVWDRALPAVAEDAWRDRLGIIAAWLADFGGTAMVDPARIEWRPLGDLTSDEPNDEPNDDAHTGDRPKGAEPDAGPSPGDRDGRAT